MGSINTIAGEVLAALDDRRQIQPFPNLDLDTAYSVTEEVRRRRAARGEHVVGRKIGFTNRTIWDEYGVYAPIWGYMYDTTVHKVGSPFDLSPFPEPRIEPEICFGLAQAPKPGMDEAALLSCIAWVAHGFEIVQSLFPGWRFSAADTVAAFGLHGAYIMGPRQSIDTFDDFEITLEGSNGTVEEGRSSDVLGGPLSALRHILTIDQPLAAGEIVTTGTLTRALPVASGETWRTTLRGIPLDGIEVSFT